MQYLICLTGKAESNALFYGALCNICVYQSVIHFSNELGGLTNVYKVAHRPYTGISVIGATFAKLLMQLISLICPPKYSKNASYHVGSTLLDIDT